MTFDIDPQQERRMRGLAPIEDTKDQEGGPNISPITTLMISYATGEKRYPKAPHRELLTQEDLKLAIGKIEEIKTIDWNTIEPHQLELMLSGDSPTIKMVLDLVRGLAQHL
ncbi:MAG: hypothetical protein UX65_C0017G0005 [Parcubacteria group bacterium GW2011_GWB1_46_8]|nr:MAG: hypothetical protein UX14_C0006G0004 [Parcubacteria group bacterium GW2011_GWF1_45_5]KKU45854.1 MAG: hypothetical protein UX65_C0017G0005 [Parcubacteria group bacterium GW2011_GWB1_46_8]